MIIKQILKKSVYASLFIVVYLNSTTAIGQTDFTTFEVGQNTLTPYDAADSGGLTPFQTITFTNEFLAPPNVFVLTPEFDDFALDTNGMITTTVIDQPCIIRIRNITTTGFDAVCLEETSTRTDNAVNVSIPFDYIAIQDSGNTPAPGDEDDPFVITVPLTDGDGDGMSDGDVIFQSGCNDISAVQFNGSCPMCGTEGFTDISFSPSFIARPALLTQIQTTNNTVVVGMGSPVGDPSFIDTDVRTGVTNSGFGLAIDRMEAGVSGPLVAERICYLAVERTTACQMLNFESFGGPTTPVPFQALETGDTIVGHDNVRDDAGAMCTGANFATGCFTGTPIVLAKKITNDGADGGLLRSCDVSATGTTFLVDEDTLSQAERRHTTEQASVFAFGMAFTTPVNLNSAQVSLFNRKASFKWETSAETFHLGFNLWGESSDGWVQLNPRLIAGNGADTDQTQTYNRTIRLSREQANEITNFGISSVDSTGYEEFYGPFKEGQPYGEEANNEPVDWTSTRTAFEQSMRERGFVQENNRWRRLSSGAQAQLIKNDLGVDQAMFEIQVSATGIHSIKASDLIALNPSWNRERLRNISLTLNGQALPRHIVSSNKRLDTNDQIIFNAQVVQGNDTPFLEHYTYRISIDRSNAIDANTFDGTVTDLDEASLATAALTEQTITSKKLHSAGLTTGDPWYDTRLLTTGSTASVEYNVDFDQPIQTEKEAKLDVLLFGSLDFPGDGDDHHIKIYVNDQLVNDLRFDGLVGKRLDLSLEAGLLKQTGNTVRVDIIGDTGFFADVVLVDEITISAFSVLTNETRQIVDFADLDESNGYSVETHSDDVEVYAYTSTGLLSTVSATKRDGVTAFARLPFQVNSNSESKLRYAVGSANGWASPSSISVVTGQDLHTQENNFLIVAHPTFIGETLDEYVAFKTGLGYNVRVVDWLEIVSTYGYGNNTPAALNNFLSAANQLYTTDNVLLVGGHTFDYFGITDENVVNFIPSHYRPVSVFEYTATDNPYADLDGDNLPEIAIGRWPVRSLTDLQTIIKKTKDWHQNREVSPDQSAYLLAQATDGQSLNFTDQLNARVRSPLSLLSEIESIEILSLDNVPEGVIDTVEFTRAELAGQINGGTDIVSFSGHGGPTAWGFQNIINTNFVKGLENQGEPVLLMPLACYITHYESVTTNTLAHQWLFAGDIGAVAIHGASVLGEYRSNGLFAERYIKESKTSKTIGQAILKAKQASGSSDQILQNWALLGDPTLPVR